MTASAINHLTKIAKIHDDAPFTQMKNEQRRTIMRMTLFDPLFLLLSRTVPAHSALAHYCRVCNTQLNSCKQVTSIHANLYAFYNTQFNL